MGPLGGGQIRLPEGLRFDLPNLKSLRLERGFHSTLIDALSKNEACFPACEIECAFWNYSIGPINLTTYVFHDRFIAAIKTWRISVLDDDEVENTTLWNLFVRLTHNPKFQPTSLFQDSFEVEDLERRETSWAWPNVANLGSLQKISGVKVGTRDLLVHGIPPNVKKLDLYLDPQGLDEAECETVLQILAKADQCEIHVLHNDDSLEDIDPLVQRESEYWGRVAASESPELRRVKFR